MSNLKKNFIYQSTYQILTMILPLVTSPILSRSLGAEGLGVYTYVTTIESYFVLFANLGIYKYGTREIAKVQNDREKLCKVFWEIWTLHFMFFLMVGLFFAVYIVFAEEYTLFFSITFLGYLASELKLEWFFIGVEDFKKITMCDAIVKSLSFILIVILVKEKDDLIIYFCLMSICSLLGVVSHWGLCREYISVRKVTLKNVFRHCYGMLILFVPLLLESLFFNMDKVMLGIFCEKAEVGYYGNAEKVLITKRLVYSISIVLLPKMSYLLSKKNQKEFHRLMKSSIGLIILLSSAFGFGTAAVAKEFSVIFWGPDFVSCSNLIMILSFAMPGSLVANAIREQYLVAGEKEKMYLLAAGSGTIVNFIINLLLIPIYGAAGAAIATLVSEYVVLLVQVYAVRKSIPILKYIHGNEIYLVFGGIMFFIVRWAAGAMDGGITALLAEIVIGAVVFSILCSAFWIMAKKYDYLNLIKRTVMSFLH